MIGVFPFRGAPSRVGRDATAFALRDPGYVIQIIGIWEDPADNERGNVWARDTWSDVHPFSVGTYLNWTNNDDADNLRAAYSPTYERLVEAIKRQYDPTDLFLVNRPLTRGG
jgi:hypothetical protein